MIVLYVAHDLENPDSMCPGSSVCLSIVEKMEEDIINIQDCDVLRQSKVLPEWLNGTPILIDDDEAIPHKGKEAIHKLRMLQKSFPRKEKAKNILSQETKDENDLSADFQMDVQPIEENSSGKITEQDLQRYMEARNSSPAGQNAKNAK